MRICGAIRPCCRWRASAPEERKLFDDLPRGIATPTPDQLGRPLPEPHASWVPALEQAWLKRYSA